MSRKNATHPAAELNGEPAELGAEPTTSDGDQAESAAQPVEPTSLLTPQEEQWMLDAIDRENALPDDELEPLADWEDESRSFSPDASQEAYEIDVGRYPGRRRFLGKTKRGRHHRSKEAFKRALALNPPPKHVPDFGAGSVALSPYVLRSAAFGAGNAAWHARRVIAEGGGTWVALPSGDGDEVLCSGSPMSPDTAAVLFGILHAARGKSFDTTLQLRPDQFIQDVLGWPDTHHSRLRLFTELETLASARLMRDWSDVRYEELTAVKLLTVERTSQDKVLFQVPSSLAHAFRGYQTYIPLRRLAQLTRKLDRWLFLMICASGCRHPFGLARIRQLYGTTQEQSDFGRDVRTALETLVEHDLIAAFKPGRGIVKVVKKTKPGREESASPDAPAEVTQEQELIVSPQATTSKSAV